MNAGRLGLGIITRVPRRGRSKTRLGAALGADHALAFHRAFLQDELTQLHAPERWVSYLVHDAPADATERALIQAVAGEAATPLAVGRGSLGADLWAAFETLLARHGRVVIVSADVPHIDAERVQMALEALERADVVLGPGPDGGYYLVGLREPHDLFTEIPMGTPNVVAATLARARALGLSVAMVPPMTDMDEAHDLLALEYAPPDLARTTRSLVASLDRGDVAARLPSDLQIEVTSRCNLTCGACLRTHQSLAPDRSLEIAEFDAIIAGLPELHRVVFQLNGEPLMNRSVPEMIARARARGAATVMNTNGTLLSRRTRARLLDAGLDELRVSFHGAQAATHNAAVGAPVFGGVVANLRELMRLRGNGPSPRVTLWLIAMRDTLPELEALVRLGADIGVDGVYLQRLVVTGQGSATTSQSVYGAADEPAVAEALAAAEATAQALGMTLQASGRLSPDASLRAPEGDNPWLGCWRPWRSAVVTAHLDVLPCCIGSFQMGYADLRLGSLRESTWEEIWNSDRVRALRSALLSARPPACCRGCTTQWSL